MIRVTRKGHDIMLQALTGSIRRFSLFGSAGEIDGQGYESVSINPDEWEGGAYPDVIFKFSGGEPLTVLGYFATSEDGTIIYDEEFVEPFEIKRGGGEITVSARLLLITQGA